MKRRSFLQGIAATLAGTRIVKARDVHVAPSTTAPVQAAPATASEALYSSIIEAKAAHHRATGIICSGVFMQSAGWVKAIPGEHLEDGDVCVVGSDGMVYRHRPAHHLTSPVGVWRVPHTLELW